MIRPWGPMEGPKEERLEYSVLSYLVQFPTFAEKEVYV